MLVRTVLCLALVLLARTPARADEVSDSESTPIPTPTLHGELGLSLADAVAMGIENNLDVEILRHQPLITEQGTHVAWGAYDPVVESNFGYSSVETPVATPLQSGLVPDSGRVEQNVVQTRNTGGSSGLQGFIPWLGGSYELVYDGARETGDSRINSLSPDYDVSAIGRVTLPVMKGLFWSEPWTEVKLSGVRYEQSLEGFRRDLMNVVQQIERAYWNLVAREEDLRVADKSLETAQALLEQTQAQHEVGVVSRVEVVEAEAGLADREFNRIGAKNRYRGAQDSLIDVVLGPYLTPESRVEIRPTDRPERISETPDVGQSSELAFRFRPELEVARDQIEQNEIQAQFARNQRLPRLDVVGSYGYGGLGGKPKLCSEVLAGCGPGLGPNDPVPLAVGRSYSDAHDDFFSDDGALQWSARAVFSIPLGNQQARGRARIAEIELRRSRTQLRRVEQDIILEVRKAVRDVNSSAEGIEAAERRSTAATEQLRAESIRLEHGESTPFEVLLREQDLVEAESQHIFALQAYQDSLAALDRAQGTILRNHNVVVEQARTLR